MSTPFERGVASQPSNSNSGRGGLVPALTGVRAIAAYLVFLHHFTPSAETVGSVLRGMLTEAQMKQLDASNGKAFDETFLQLMIQHHQGALVMVKELFGTPGAGQDETTFKLANDISADQETEIARMQKMLIAFKLGVAPQ